MSKKASTVVDKLFRVPKKDKGDNMPHFSNYPPNYINQADILYLPHDGQYKYALVVVDIGTRFVGAQPIKSRKVQDIKSALEKIYSKKLEWPSILETDNGSEFKGDFKSWLKEHDVKLKYSQPYRHRQLAIVERYNQIIGKELFKRMISEELQTNVPSSAWISDLPKVVDKINKKSAKRKAKTAPDNYICQDDSCNMLETGTLVRYQLDEPIDVVNGKRLPGKFRSTDVRFSIKPKIITKTILKPNKPPLYFLDDSNVPYTKNQLQVVEVNEIQPQKSDIRPINTKKGKKLHVIDEILGNKKKMSHAGKNLIHYQVKWKDGDITYEPRKYLLEDVPDLIKEFEQNKLNHIK
jgi:hypothetical protein